MWKTLIGPVAGGLAGGAVALVASGAPVHQPAPYQVQPVTHSPQPVARPAVQTPAVEQRAVREHVVYRDRPQPDARRAPKRSWTKTVMVIGGTAGTGAGVGAMAGGKKGALIGAALGGGAASIFEAVKR